MHLQVICPLVKVYPELHVSLIAGPLCNLIPLELLETSNQRKAYSNNVLL